MSAPHFEMSPSLAWEDQHVAPQLEQEYGLDANMFNVLHSNLSPPQGVHRRHTPSQAASSNPPFSTYNPAFSQQPFNFTMQVPGQQTSSSQNGTATQNSPQGYFQPIAGPSGASSAQQQQFIAQNDMFRGSASTAHQSQINAFRDQSMFTSYPQHGVDMRSGPSQTHNRVSPFSSPPAPFPQAFPADMAMADQNLVQTGYGSPGRSDAFVGQNLKRMRTMDAANGSYDYDPEDSDERETLPGQDIKPKIGACERCKGLKVKCEFKSGQDKCKRCHTARAECTIPGRKKRRAPPKREHLLTQIREQTEKINKLMAELEEANRKVEEARANAFNAPSPSQSTATTDSFSLISSVTSPDFESDSTHDSTVDSTRTNADVMDWIAKARESIKAFGGYISMGGPSATREMLAADEDEAPLLDGPEEDEFDIDVETVDGGDDEAGYSGDEGSVATSRRSVSEAPLKKDRLATIPNEAAPFGLMANLHLTTKGLKRIRSRSSVGAEEEPKEDLGLANADYFRPSPALERPIIENHQAPHILRCGLVSPAEVEKLFTIYWDYMNLSVSLLDPGLYSAQQTYWRSPFLFTVICGIASRFYSARPELYQQVMHYARLAAGTALIGGQKTVECVHAYILLSLYPVPARKWEDDRSWVYLGVAIRIATDLNLHHPNTAKPKDEMHAREMLNRTRAWLNCFNLDRSTSSQYGKSPIISNTDYTANHSAQWWNSSPYNMKNFDIQLAGYNAELTIVGKFRAKIHSDPDSPTGFNKSLDLAALASETDDELGRLWVHWLGLLREHTDPNDIRGKFRSGLLRLAYSYARMSVLSFGFQYAFGKTSVGQDVTLLWRCLRAAFDVLNAILEDIAVPNQKIFLCHGPEAQSVFVTFACAFLLKLMQPRYASYVSREQRLEIRDKVEKIADLLGSPEVAIDDQHGPKLYSSFLKGLLAAPVTRVDRPIPSGRRAVAKSKSVSPTTQKSDLADDTQRMKSASSTPVTPSAIRQSVTPEPEQGLQAMSADNGFGTSAHQDAEMLSGLGMDMNVSEFFSPPLPFESELLQSMADQSLWPDMAMPGFAWMGSYHQSN